MAQHSPVTFTVHSTQPFLLRLPLPLVCKATAATLICLFMPFFYHRYHGAVYPSGVALLSATISARPEAELMNCQLSWHLNVSYNYSCPHATMSSFNTGFSLWIDSYKTRSVSLCRAESVHDHLEYMVLALIVFSSCR